MMIQWSPPYYINDRPDGDGERFIEATIWTAVTKHGSAMQNRSFYAGDNLPFLRAHRRLKSIHLIATDPPFNKSRNFYSSRNRRRLSRPLGSWERDVQPEEMDQSHPRRIKPRSGR